MARRVDANQREIVERLRDYGATVFVLSEVGRGCPDIMFGIFGENYLVEIKDGKKPLSAQKLTEKEIAFFQSWKGQVCIFRFLHDVDDFMHMIRSKEKKYVKQVLPR